jgi:hypothetical protein
MKCLIPDCQVEAESHGLCKEHGKGFKLKALYPLSQEERDAILVAFIKAGQMIRDGEA